MKQEDKQLLLKDLCARVPYHPKGHVINNCNGAKCDEWLTCATVPMFTSIANNCRLYLRSMSSMTDEEQKEFDEFCVIDEDAWMDKGISGCINQAVIMSKGVDWLNNHHLDYRGLIEKGLAIEAPEGMYNIKE